MLRAFIGTTIKADDHPRSVRSATDSFCIGIGIFASGCMYPDSYHFIPYKASEVQDCKGITAGLNIEGRGTLKFRIDNGDVVRHTINVPNYVHIPYLPMVLVSPQH